jgi:hypothetical protein
LSKRRLKRGGFRSIVELQAAINRDPRPFCWTKSPKKILAVCRVCKYRPNSMLGQSKERWERLGSFWSAKARFAAAYR